MGTITRIPFPLAEPEDWLPIKGTYCPPYDGEPQHEVADDPKPVPLWKFAVYCPLAAALMWGAAWLVHGV